MINTNQFKFIALLLISLWSWSLVKLSQHRLTLLLIQYPNFHSLSPNLPQMDRSPLHIAAERGHTAIVEMLVDKFKANVAARTKDGSTLMHISSQFGHPETALAFLKKGVPMLMPNKVRLALPDISTYVKAGCSNLWIVKF